ncbi:MAG: YceI family protein [Lentimicrobium sp.]|nr:YceI family protein [Lentimicrobium sp.]
MTNFGKLFSLAIMAGLIASCGGPQGEKAVTSDAQEVSVKSGDVTLKLDQSSSNIEWVGAKPTGEHNGTIDFQGGELMLTEGSIVGGNFTIDMNSIKNLDLTSEEDNAKLVGHLKSPDFFDVEKYPTAVFQITSVEPLTGNAEANHSITGNLTMKDVTRSITFPAMVTIDDASVTATSPVFVIDRTQWKVEYGSKTLFKNLQDKFINDEISLMINLKAGM